MGAGAGLSRASRGAYRRGRRTGANAVAGIGRSPAPDTGARDRLLSPAPGRGKRGGGRGGTSGRPRAALQPKGGRKFDSPQFCRLAQAPSVSSFPASSGNRS